MTVAPTNNLGTNVLAAEPSFPARANDKVGQVDAALTEDLSKSVTAGNITLTSDEYLGNFLIEITDATVGGRTVTLPIHKKFSVIRSAAANTQSISIVRGSTSISLSPGKSGLFYTYGTTNDLIRPLTDDLAAPTLPFELTIACSDETTALTAGTNKVVFRMSRAVTITTVRANLTTAQASGSIFTVDINEAGSTILSTKLTIDNTETTSVSAATPPVISDSSLADDVVMSVDIDQVGDGTAKGLKVTLIGTRV